MSKRISLGKIGCRNMMYGKNALLGTIREAVEAMDGLDHTGCNAVSLASAIKQITRRGSRTEAPTTPPDIPAIAGFETGSAFAITVTQDMIDEDSEGRGGFTFGFYGINLKSGHASYSVNWGDGTQNVELNVSISAGSISATCLGNTGTSAAQTGTNGTVTDGTAEVCHTYSMPGTYVIQISDDINWFGLGGGNIWGDPWTNLINAGKNVLAKRVTNAVYAVSHALRWGGGVTSAVDTYSGCGKLLSPCAWNTAITSALFTYAYCYKLSGNVPAWNSAITTAQYTYYGCRCLTGTVPEWGTAINNAEDTYSGCSGLTGRIPAWTSRISNATSAYSGCSGLTGEIPDWGSSITSTSLTYSGCSGLTGNIPAWTSAITRAGGTYQNCFGLEGTIPTWGSSITDASSTYYGCSGLTGNIPAWTSAITNARTTYWGCSGLTGSVPAWGAAITNAGSTYESCTGLTGSVPAWGAAITNAGSTYRYCYGLTGRIPVWGTAITNASSTYQYCSNLTGVWDSTATDAELMPSNITSKGNCVNGCHPDLRQYFLTSWGGTRTS